MWILKNFVTSVLHFHIVVERLTVSSVQSAQSPALRFVKQCLNLPCNCTPGTAFHPDVLDLSFFLISRNLLSYLISWLLNALLTKLLLNCGILACLMTFRMHQMLFLMLFLLLNLQFLTSIPLLLKARLVTILSCSLLEFHS